MHLVLLTTRRSSLATTMLSRLRPYLFPGRSPEDEREVIARIFRDESGRFADLRGFFLAWREINPERLATAARSFLDRALDPEAGLELPDELAAVLTPKRARDGGTDASRGRERDTDPSRARATAIAFLEELSGALRGALRGGGAGVDLLEGWAAAVPGVPRPHRDAQRGARHRAAGARRAPARTAARGRTPRVRKFIQKALERLDRLDPEQVAPSSPACRRRTSCSTGCSSR